MTARRATLPSARPPAATTACSLASGSGGQNRPPDDPPPRVVGYGRTADAGTALATARVLEEHACTAIHLDVTAARACSALPALTMCLATLRASDLLVIPGLAHLAATLPELLTRLSDLQLRKVEVLVLDDGIDTRTPSGRALYASLPLYLKLSRGWTAAPAKGRAPRRREDAQSRHRRSRKSAASP